MSQSRQLAAIMFTDIVGYTALMGEDEQKAFELLKNNRRVQKPIIEKFNGRWLKEIGDGVLASFSTVSDAVYCAGAIQKACENEPDLKLRIGIHEGEVVFEGDDVFGDAVNIASRLEPLAPIGGILVSESVHKNVHNKKGIVSNLVGEKELRGVKESVKVYEVTVVEIESRVFENDPYSIRRSVNKSVSSKKIAIVIIGTIFMLLLSYVLYTNQFKIPPVDEPRIEITDKSIAVLPFADLSANNDQEYFSEGLAEELIYTLAQIPNLKVASRTSSFLLSKKGLPIKLIADSLGVSTILEGSVRKFENRIKVTVQLINASNGFHLWSQTYERELVDIFAIQDELSRSIVNALQLKISKTNGQLVKKQTANIEAYNFFLKGRYSWNKRSRQGLERSIEYFEQALEKDSLYALAYSGLADSYNSLTRWELSDPSTAYPRSKEAALKALELDNSLGQAHASWGGVQQWHEWNWSAAEESYKTAISLDPNYAQVHVWYFLLSSIMGDFEKAEVHINKAIALEPLSLITSFRLAHHYLQLGDYPNAILQAQHTLEIGESFVPANLTLYQIYYAMGENDLSFKYYLKTIFAKNQEELQASYDQGGWEAAATLMISWLESNSTYVSQTSFARLYIHLRNNKKALDYLEAGYSQRDSDMIFIGLNQPYRTLSHEPRYQALLKKMKLPPVTN